MHLCFHTQLLGKFLRICIICKWVFMLVVWGGTSFTYSSASHWICLHRVQWGPKVGVKERERVAWKTNKRKAKVTFTRLLAKVKFHFFYGNSNFSTRHGMFGSMRYLIVQHSISVDSIHPEKASRKHTDTLVVGGGPLEVWIERHIYIQHSWQRYRR